MSPAPDPPKRLTDLECYHIVEGIRSDIAPELR